MEQPLVVALKSSKPESALLLLENGANPNVVTANSHTYMQSSWSRNPGESALDLVTGQLETLRDFDRETEETSTRPPVQQYGLDNYLELFEEGSYQYFVISNATKKAQKTHQESVKTYEKNLAESGTAAEGAAEKAAAIKGAIATLEKIEEVLRTKGAKTFNELFPDYRATNTRHIMRKRHDGAHIKGPYEYVFTFWSATDVTNSRHAAYLEL